MSEQIDPLKILTTARDKLVDERRALSVAMALGYRRRRTDDNHTNEMRMGFVSIQDAIEAIDRAIADEKLIARDHPVSIVIPEFETDPSSGAQFGNRQ